MDPLIKMELIDGINQLDIKREEDLTQSSTIFFSSFPPSALMVVSALGIRVEHGSTYFFHNSQFTYDVQYNDSNQSLNLTLHTRPLKFRRRPPAAPANFTATSSG
ncbi:hypothetical protein M3Y94_01273000 [Aphelenchoides besseyi]|nr:hypothetical protein M3Y94_01273000 [Aphelenchoides besseyi]